MPLKHPKAKGNRLENEVVQVFREAGYTSDRCWASNGKSRGLPEEVDVVVEKVIDVLDGFGGHVKCDMHIQCKSVARLASKFIPSERIDAVVYKENRGEKYILMKLDSFIQRFMT